MQYPKSSMENLLTTKDVMEMLKVSRVTLHRMRKDGLKYVKIGDLVRFRPEDVKKFVRENIEKQPA